MIDRRKITMQGNPVTVRGKQLAAGDTAPDFTLVGNDFNPVSLQDFGSLDNVQLLL